MKRMATWWLAVIVVLLGLGVAYCGDDDNNAQQDAGMDAQTLRDRYVPDAGDSGPSTASIFGTVADPVRNVHISGATACWDPDGLNICGTSNAMGFVSLQGLPADTDGLIVVSGSEFLDSIYARVSPPGSIEAGFPVLDATSLEFVYSTADASVTAGTGTVIVGAVYSTINAEGNEVVHGLTGATMSLSGATADGPFYLAGDTTNGIDPSLTTSGGSGDAVFLNVTPGDVDVAIADGGVNCRIGRYTDLTGPRSVPVESGKVSWTTFWCDEP